MTRAPSQLFLESAPLILLAGVVAVFAVIAPGFHQPGNLLNMVAQASSTGIVAVGMTFVLLTAGVDLSVGAIMFIAAAIGGKLLLQGSPIALVLPAMVLIGVVAGSINALLITRLRLIPFVVTLATLYLGRGFALWITETRAMNLPDAFITLGSSRIAGLPTPVLVFAGVVLVAHVALRHTPFGRQVCAIGHDLSAARKAGVATGRILAGVYVISGCCAAIGAIVALSQLGAVSPRFGLQKEFSAIAAAVLGGTSLFGGRGNVFPGTVLGALLMQTVENGLVMANADPYLYPVVTSGIIFLAVLLDSLRNRLLATRRRRVVRVEA